MSERFELPAELNIYSAMDTRSALLAWIEEQGSKAVDVLEISARDVAEVDGSGLQMIVSLANLGEAWRLVECSDAFSEACKSLGFSYWIEGHTMKNANGGATV